MNVYTLFGLIAVITIGVTIITLLINRKQNIGVAYLRNFLGTFFIFSGAVKAIDPVGTAIKMEDYFTIFTDYMPFLSGLWNWCNHYALAISVFMIVLEIALGISLIFGTLRRITLFLYVAIIVFFTFLTGFSHLTGKVTDCGCFGDFVKLKPYVSFLKDVVLTIMLVALLFFANHIKPLFNNKAALFLLLLLTVGTYFFTMSNYYNEPIIDFRAYKVGTDLLKGKSMEGLDEGLVKIYYTLKNASTGETKEMEGNEYTKSRIWEDKNWTMVNEKTRQEVIREPEQPLIKDFIVQNTDGEDVADSLLQLPGYHFFVCTYNIDKISNKGFPEVNRILADAQKAGLPVNGITSSPIEDAEKLVNNQYPFYLLDATPIKTWIRSNPGVVLMKGPVIIAEYHGEHLPEFSEIKKAFNIP
ncbi:MAG: hypothetical protein IPI59_13475 [Sphingobacteriales bacterium]|jgi:uncharacterized membrane protein YphA (DoxX/SURF4 family)|nr:hypothetical protein [Sphingobacteriales bacterium]MBP9140196.1 hypothetical protein [Chitinophagales bacterium]MBK6888971.1 hypothetical protein [Sphingobacteriales bacterium]MBK7528527.1 hypothetical protein [Sphingobacteriales bacterium]MBL0246622.1 hypothetical protein [Sphingobacteriales bacterium]